MKHLVPVLFILGIVLMIIGVPIYLIFDNIGALYLGAFGSFIIVGILETHRQKMIRDWKKDNNNS